MRRTRSLAALVAALAGGWLLATPGAGVGDLPVSLEAGSASLEASPATPPTSAVPLPAGYVPDTVCATCHDDVAASFADVGMAKSFHRPAPERIVEDYSQEPFFHAPSERWFEMRWRDGRPVFRRWQVDGAGRPVNVFEQPVDWVLGSGHRARSYLYANPAGELFLLPVDWYAQEGRWGMAPGFDRPDHLGVLRRVARDCMFCHNAYPGEPAPAGGQAMDRAALERAAAPHAAAASAPEVRGTAASGARASDAHGMPARFPAELPQGIGCQRCHGPGSRHVDLASGGVGTAAEIRAAVVNPARLAPERRDDVCWQCHMQPSVAMSSVRAMGRGVGSYRPGEPLPDYEVHSDVVETQRSRGGERFEINHHAYRLIQSPCWQESGRRLTCVTCHDPHAKVAPAERVAHYRAACQQCHGEEACDRGHGGAGQGEGGSPTWSPAEARAAAADDCVACHMPQRRTQDVVQVVMTDHRIVRRPPPAAERLAPLAELDPVLEEVAPLHADRAPEGELGSLYRALAVVRTAGGASSEALDALERMLARIAPEAPDAWYDLARGLLQRREIDRAERALTAALERSPEHPEVLQLLGVLAVARQRPAEGAALLRRAVEAGGQPEAHYNLSRALLALGEPEAARGELERAVALRPTFTAAWHALGQLREQLAGHDAEASTLSAAVAGEDAAGAYRRALAISPEHAPSYIALGRLLLARGERAEALRWLEHGARVSSAPEAVAAVLEEARARQE
ncbi:MAG TPA: tetratricopeptide repeat protein [Thermoanaerobaculia bacterium]|nr:tetratricopeptide repeat protein [Thermoanaerobaculia bacterium]